MCHPHFQALSLAGAMMILLKHVRFLYLCWDKFSSNSLVFPSQSWVGCVYNFFHPLLCLKLVIFATHLLRARSRRWIKYFIMPIKSTCAKIKLCQYPQLVFLIQSKILRLSNISKEEVNLVLGLLICCMFF